VRRYDSQKNTAAHHRAADDNTNRSGWNPESIMIVVPLHAQLAEP
jgi:hypothetical protein